MEFEIGNPSDKCFVSADEDIVVSAAVTLLGRGQYFVQAGDDRKFPTFFALGGDPDVAYKEAYGITFSDFFKQNDNLVKVADCLASFRYAGERSSMNNIGAEAAALTETLRKRAAQTTNTPSMQAG